MKVTKTEVEMGHFDKMLHDSFDRLRQLFQAESDSRKGNNKRVGHSKLRGTERSSHGVLNEYLTTMRKSSKYSNEQRPRVETVTLMLGITNSQTVGKNHHGYIHPFEYLYLQEIPRLDDWPNVGEDIHHINDASTINEGYI